MIACGKAAPPPLQFGAFQAGMQVQLPGGLHPATASASALLLPVFPVQARAQPPARFQYRIGFQDRPAGGGAGVSPKPTEKTVEANPNCGGRVFSSGLASASTSFRTVAKSGPFRSIRLAAPYATKRRKPERASAGMAAQASERPVFRDNVPQGVLEGHRRYG